MSNAEKDQKQKIVTKALGRFPSLPNRAVARYILDTHGLLWDNDLEQIRRAVRYYTGNSGEKDKCKNVSHPFFNREVVMPKTWRQTRTDYKLNPGLWLVLADLHIPFHEPKPIEAAIAYGHKRKVTGILFLGDLQDCAALGIWHTRKRDWMAEVEATIDFLDFIRGEFPKAEMVYKPGNHEYRLPRYYISNAPELIESPVTAMESHLGFEERGIEFLDYHQTIRAGKLPLIHGHEVQNIDGAVNPARGLYLKAKSFAMCAHCHRTSSHTERDINGRIMTTWSVGCLCDLSPDYRPINNWNWGGGILKVEKNGDFEVENFRILPSGEVVQ